MFYAAPCGIAARQQEQVPPRLLLMAAQMPVRAASEMGCWPPVPAVIPVITPEPQTMLGAAAPVHEAVELQLLCSHGGHNTADAPDLHVKVGAECFGGNAGSRMMMQSAGPTSLQ